MAAADAPFSGVDSIPWIWYVLMIGFTALLGWTTFRVMFRLPQEMKEDEDNKASDEKKNGHAKKKGGAGSDKKSSKTKSKGVADKVKPEKFSHPWLESTLKGHAGNVLDIDLSPNNKLLASCADDRTVYVWVTKDFSEKEHKSFRANISFDHGTLCRWSPDNKAFIVARKGERCIELFKVVRKPDNSIQKIQGGASVWHLDASAAGELVDIIGLGIACTGKFIMNFLSNGYLELRDLKGTVQERLVTPLQQPLKALITPCGRYVAVSSPSEIVVYEIKVKDGAKMEANVKWQIKPTKASSKISDFSWNTDSSKVAVVCEDGSWMVYDTTGNRVNVDTEGVVNAEDSLMKPIIAISPDGRIVAVGWDQSIYFFSGFTGKPVGTIEDAFKDSVSGLVFTADCKHLAVAGDSIIHLFKNAPWYNESIERLKGQLNDVNLTTSTRQRLTSELNSFMQEIKKYGWDM